MKNEIFSLDKSRICIDKSGSTPIFRKKTNIDEVNNLLKAKNLLENFSNVLIKEKNYTIKVPKVYDFDDKTETIKMEFFKGKNLETLIRNKDTHTEYVYFLNYLLDFLISNNFSWGDFAPRNILVSSNEICLVDFEKQFYNKIDNLSEYLHNHVYEEYSSFLFLNERIFSIDDVFSIDSFKNEKINIDDIKIKRLKYLAKTMFENNNSIYYADYLKIWKYILTAEIPFIYNDNFIFPRLFLSNILENKLVNDVCYYNYSKAIILLNNDNLSINEKYLTLRKL